MERQCEDTKSAEQMKLEANEMLDSKIVDKVIEELELVTSANLTNICAEIKENKMQFLVKYKRKGTDVKVKERCDGSENVNY